MAWHSCVFQPGWTYSTSSLGLLNIVALISSSASSIHTNPSSKLKVNKKLSLGISHSVVPWCSFASKYRFIGIVSRVWQTICTHSGWGSSHRALVHHTKCSRGASLSDYFSVRWVFAYSILSFIIHLYSFQSTKLSLCVPTIMWV